MRESIEPLRAEVQPRTKPLRRKGSRSGKLTYIIRKQENYVVRLIIFYGISHHILTWVNMLTIPILDTRGE